MHDLQEEQKTLELKQVAVQSMLTNIHASKCKLDQFKDLVHSFSEIEELNYGILNNLTKRIDVGSLETTTGKRLQKINITWKY